MSFGTARATPQTDGAVHWRRLLGRPADLLERAPIGDWSSRRKWSDFPALAASQRAARAPAQRILFFTKSGTASDPLRLRFPALGYGTHRAPAPQMAFADTDRIVRCVRSLSRLALLIVALAAVAVGCSGGESATDPTSDPGDWEAVLDTARGQTLDLYMWGGSSEINVSSIAPTVRSWSKSLGSP